MTLTEFSDALKAAIPASYQSAAPAGVRPCVVWSAYGSRTLDGDDRTQTAIPKVQLDILAAKFPEYARLMRRSYRVTVRFSDGGDELLCNISTTPIEAHNISFDDGKSQLQNLDYSASGTAKLTVLCDVDTGEKDADGEPIVSRQRSTWYLAEDGAVSQTVPARRASGTWDTISVKKLEEVETKVIETFAKNKTNHKLEFWSTLNLNVQDNCTFYAYGEILRSYISYKRKSSEDSRYYYKSGDWHVDGDAPCGRVASDADCGHRCGLCGRNRVFLCHHQHHLSFRFDMHLL